MYLDVFCTYIYHIRRAVFCCAYRPLLCVPCTEFVRDCTRLNTFYIASVLLPIVKFMCYLKYGVTYFDVFIIHV
jgi:hypothetical protein